MGTPVVGLIGVGILGAAGGRGAARLRGQVVVRDVVTDAVAGLTEMGAASGVVVGRGGGALQDSPRPGADRRPVPHGGGRGARAAAPGDDRGDGDGAARGGRGARRPAAARSVALVDAPLASQGVASIVARAMWVLAGGEAEVVERLRPVVEPFAARLVHTAAAGRRLHSEAGPQRDGVPRLSGRDRGRGAGPRRRRRRRPGQGGHPTRRRPSPPSRRCSSTSTSAAASTPEAPPRTPPSPPTPRSPRRTSAMPSRSPRPTGWTCRAPGWWRRGRPALPGRGAGARSGR